ncbi:phosphate ABC transporter permease subunit PstC [Gemmatimonadota bacterium]
MRPGEGAEAGDTIFTLGRNPDLVGRIFGWLFALCAGITALVTVGIVLTLLKGTVGFFAEVSLWEFLTETRWTPLFQEKHFGILPLLGGSVLVAAGAGILALPTGLMTAIFLSEVAGERLRALVKPAFEILAGVPTVVYGYFALTFVTPALRSVFPGTEIFNAASAAIVVGIMILPMVSSLSDEALRAVPSELREAALGLGASRFRVVTRVVVPAGLSGILASFILALSRAMGETMAVAIAAGFSPRLTVNPLESIQTMTAYILRVGQGEVSPGSIEYRTLFAVGMSLFLITFVMNLLGRWILARSREAHG